MATTTTYFNLRKDDKTDFYDINVFNNNFDKIDSALKSIQTTANDKNATTFLNKNISSFQLKETGYSFYNQDKDWNDITDSGYYALSHQISKDKNNPIEGRFFFPFVLKYDINNLTQVAFPLLYGNNGKEGHTYIRSKNDNYGGWCDWHHIGDGCNAKDVNKITRTFTVNKGNWYRLAYTNDTPCGGIIVLNVDANGYGSTTVFSSAQQYSNVTNNNIISSLAHSDFNTCVTKIRLARKYGEKNQYIDFYLEDGLEGSTGKIEVQFFGVGWNFYNEILTKNIATTDDYKEINLKI